MRRLIQYSFDNIFSHPNPLHTHRPYTSSKTCDLILCPTAVGPAPTLKGIASLKPVETYINDVFTVPASLAGLPAVSVPVRVNGRILGIQVIGQVGMDAVVLEAAKDLERVLMSE